VQNLPPRQGVVLLLRDVLSWRAAEVAKLLGTSVPAGNSALQRAHATLDCTETESVSPVDSSHSQKLIAQYLAAFDTDDVDALVRSSVRVGAPGGPWQLW
jgi:RNA polymerase sigma-70 factor (ECF subfamily)